MFFNKKTLKDVDISCLLGNGIQDGNDITTRVQNDLRDGSQSEKKENFLNCRISAHMRELHVVDITHKSDI